MTVDLESASLAEMHDRFLVYEPAEALEARRPPSPGQQPRMFAHPAEAMLGALLSFYRVRWVYEPTSFVLRRGPGGEVAESFTPDFYLPDHEIYLELTTMRQPLVTRKNGKIRRLKALYPGVAIRMLYRRDYERIVASAVRSAPRQHGEMPAIVFGQAQIAARAVELAGEIAAALGAESRSPEPLVLTTIKPEAEPFQRLLARELAGRGLDTILDSVEISRFHPGSLERRATLIRRPETVIGGRDVLVVAGVTSTGLSLDFAMNALRKRGPGWLDAVSLVDRASARVIETPVRFRGFDGPAEYLTGFGLSLGDDAAPFAISKSTHDTATRESGPIH